MSKIDVYNIKDIEIELLAISDVVCANGLNSFLKKKDTDIEKAIENIEVYSKELIISCHDEFKKAQERIIINVLSIQEEQIIVKEKLKQANVQKNKTEIEEFKFKKKHLEFYERLFKHCADAILWQLINGQLWIHSRLHLKVGGSKKLKDVNLESVKFVADNINSNPSNFVLITDITNNVEVGDLIGYIDSRFVIVEVKEGEKNYEVLEVIEDLKSKETDAKEVFDRYSHDNKFLKHLERTIKQEKTLSDVTEIINTDRGEDPISKKVIKILTPKEDTPFFIKELATLEKQLNERKAWAYDVIDECLHVGVYKGKFRQAGSVILKSIADSANMKNIIIVDALSAIYSLNKPIFYYPFSVDFIFDLIFERVKMYFMIDIDKYMGLYERFGLTAEWATTKETTKIAEEMKKMDIFKLKNRGIKIKLDQSNEFTAWITFGTFLKMFLEHVYPSYTAYQTLYYKQLNNDK